MNIDQEIISILKANSNNSSFQRNLIKELLQDYALNYIYSSKYKFLIFTGGTCLKKVYGLDRLSEDLDFDYTSKDTFSIKDFARDLNNYFYQLGYENISYKISGNQNTVILKFNINNLKTNSNNNLPSENIHLRCDFSVITYTGYEVEINPINTNNFSFFVKNYSLSTLFANKLVAFLSRQFFNGEFQQLPLKGRDVYDLFWFTSLSLKQAGNIKPNIEILKARLNQTDIDKIKKDITDKLALVDPKALFKDLQPLIESTEYLNTFVENFQPYLLKKLPDIIG